MDAGTVRANFVLNMDDVASKLGGAMSAISAAGDEMTRAFGSKPQKALEETEDHLSRFTWTARGYMKDITKVVTGILIAQGFYKLLNTIETATARIFEFNQSIQSASVSFEVLLGSKAEAQDFIKVLQNFAATTPATFETAAKTSQRLLAMGFQAENIVPTLRTIMDAASISGGGPDVIEGIARALGQIQTKGRVATQELLQLSERGIASFAILKEELKLTDDQMQDLGKLRIPASVAIPALLRGMEKAYGGASEKMAQTTKGIISTISDNLLSLSNNLFGKVLDSTRSKLSNFSKSLANAMVALNDGGLGGLFEHLVPKEFQNTIRSIIIGIGGLIDAFKRLMSAASPVLKAFGEAFLRAFGLLLPILTTFMQALARLMQWITSCTPLVNGLVGAISSLLIAFMVLTAIEKLYTAISLLFVAGPVAKTVFLLRDAIVALNAAMVRSPWTAILVVASAVLLGLALSSETVCQWLDAVMQRIAALLGMDMGGFLQPQSVQESADAMNDYYQNLADIQDGLDGIGTEAEKAGKKVEDSFNASFDELYQIPEKADASAGAIGGIGDLANIKIPEIQVPELHDLWENLPKEQESLTESLKDLWKNFFDWLHSMWSKYPPPLPDLFGEGGEGGGGDFPSTGATGAEAYNGILMKLMSALAAATTALALFPLVFRQTTPKVEVEVDLLGGVFEKLKQSVQTKVALAGLAALTLGSLLWNGIKQAGVKIGQGAELLREGFSKLQQKVALGVAMAGLALVALPGIFWNALKQASAKVWEGLELVGQKIVEYKEPLLVALGLLGLAIVGFFVGIPGTLAAAAVGLVAFVGTMFFDATQAAAAELGNTKTVVVSKWSEIKTSISTKLNEIGTYCITKWGNIKTGVNNVWVGMGSLASKAWDGIKEGIRGKLNGIRAIINKFINFLNTLKIRIPQVDIPLVGKAGGFSIGLPHINPIPELATGGIVTRDQLVRVGEGNKKEGVIPLESAAADPFIKKLAAEIAAQGGGEPDDRPILYIGTLIADNKALRELDRKMQVIRAGEKQRKGV